MLYKVEKPMIEQCKKHIKPCEDCLLEEIKTLEDKLAELKKQLPVGKCVDTTEEDVKKILKQIRDFYPPYHKHPSPFTFPIIPTVTWSSYKTNE